ncbi:Protein of unknown function DUF1239 [gamma proteobacterium HdN1]|nr:Protein of unknown function DUF1239 [gamma proteobacterium HdN1]
MDARNLFWSILLLAVLSSLGINGYLSWKTAPPANTAQADSLPDIILDRINQMNFDDQGDKHYQLLAETATHFTKQEVTEFQGPNLVFFDKDERSWNATSNTGITRDAGETLHLNGDVVIRKLDDKAQPVELRTQSMHVSPKAETAETDDEVDITQGGHHTHAKGLRVEMQTGKLTLQSKVISRYSPPSS